MKFVRFESLALPIDSHIVKAFLVEMGQLRLNLILRLAIHEIKRLTNHSRLNLQKELIISCLLTP